jgi:hypothetical protein
MSFYLISLLVKSITILNSILHHNKCSHIFHNYKSILIKILLTLNLLSLINYKQILKLVSVISIICLIYQHHIPKFNKYQIHKKLLIHFNPFFKLYKHYIIII